MNFIKGTGGIKKPLHYKRSYYGEPLYYEELSSLQFPNYQTGFLDKVVSNAECSIFLPLYSNNHHEAADYPEVVKKQKLHLYTMILFKFTLSTFFDNPSFLCAKHFYYPFRTQRERK